MIGGVNRELHIKKGCFKDSLNVNDIHSSKVIRATLTRKRSLAAW